MSPEERTRIYGDNKQSRVMNFMDRYTEDGYMVSNATRVLEITEAIANGNNDSYKIYQNMINLESKLKDFDLVKINTIFKDGVLNSLDNISRLLKKDNKFKDFNQFERKLTDLRTKLGVIEKLNRLEEAKASKAKTREKILALDNNPNISIEEKNKKMRELLLIYNGPNEAAILNAEKITERNIGRSKFDINFDAKFVNEINEDLKGIYNELMTTELMPDTKKDIIDEFNNVVKVRNQYNITKSKHESDKKFYENALNSLGLVKNPDKKEKVKEVDIPKEVIIEEPIEKEIEEPIKEIEKPTKEENAIVEYVAHLPEYVTLKDPSKHRYDGNIEGLVYNKNYKVVEPVIINGLTYYKLEGLGDAVFAAHNFETAKPVQDMEKEVVEPTKEQEEPVKEKSRRKKVINIKSKVKGAGVLASVVAVSYITATLVPIAGPIALIPGVAYAIQSYMGHQKRVNAKADLTMLQRVAPFLIGKITDASVEPSRTPEEKSKLDEFITTIKDSTKGLNEQEEIKTKVEPIEEEIIQKTGDPIKDSINDIESDMFSEDLTKEELVDIEMEKLSNTQQDDSLKMGGR